MAVMTAEHPTIQFDRAEVKAMGISKDPNVPYFTEAPVNVVSQHDLRPDYALEALSEVHLGSVESDEVLRIETLLDRVRQENPGYTVEHPDVICCIPVASIDEQLPVLQQLITTLASQQGARNTEYLIYGNHPTSATLNEQGEEKITAIKQWTWEHFPELPARFINVGYKYDDLTISKVRSDYMNIVLRDALERGLPYQQPIVWLDADISAMTPHVVQALAGDIRNGSSDDIFSRATLHFALEELGYDGVDSRGLSSARRAAIFYELARRCRDEGQFNNKPTYPEECGLGIALGNYVALGGVNREDVYNEGSNLADSAVLNAPRLLPLTRTVFGDKKPLARSADVVNGVGIHVLPTNIIDTSPRRLVTNASSILHRMNNGDGFELTPGTRIDGEYRNFGPLEFCRREAPPKTNYARDVLVTLMQHTAETLSTKVVPEKREEYLDTVLSYIDKV